MGAFADHLTAWTKEAEDRVEAVYRRSVELVAEDMTRTKGQQGGRMPFQTGNLSRSLVASTEGMPQAAEAAATWRTGFDIGTVTATLKTGQPVWIGFQAIYARRMEYGYVGADKLGRVFNQAGHHFVQGAIDKWPQLVAKACEEIQKGVEAKKK